MELKYFLRLLKKHLLWLLLLPTIAVVTTFFLIRKLPDTYISRARIATGIVDDTRKIPGSDKNKSESEINQEFSNLIQTMQLKLILDQVSYKLMLHDLLDKTPYRKPSQNVKDLNELARKHAIDVYTKLYNKREALSLWDNDQFGLYKVLVSMGYDDGSLMKKLKIYRWEYSDFIDIEFESENPVLSAFVVNTICNEFLNYYTTVLRENQEKGVRFLEKMVAMKQDTLNNKIQELKGYKLQNRILSLPEQARALYNQISAYEAEKQKLEQSIAANSGTLKVINQKFDPSDQQYLERSSEDINEKLIETKAQLQKNSDDLIKSNYNIVYLKRRDSLMAILDKQIKLSTDRNVYSPLSTKQSLVAQKLKLEVDLEMSKNSIATLQNEINTLNQRLDLLMPHEAVIQTYEGDIDLASKEYLEVLYKFNQANLEASYALQLRQVEVAMPNQAQPSKKIFLVLLAGVATFILYLAVLVVVFYFDQSIHDPKTLVMKTRIPSLGQLPMLKSGELQSLDAWEDNQRFQTQQFKNALRALRFEVDKELSDTRICLITSLQEGAGKTFTTLNLAYAYAKIKKKVLIIDGHFQDPAITRMYQTPVFIEDYLQNQINLFDIPREQSVSVLGNKGEDISILELQDYQTIIHQMQQLANNFDIILIEASSLQHTHNAKEWSMFARKILPVFESGRALTEDDKYAIDYLKEINGKMTGWVYNKATRSAEKKSLLKRLLNG
jgi:Mrp family chromosome partitioning ATPase/uncharacterized protein involved in exopolysaccharide biosynthesis